MSRAGARVKGQESRAKRCSLSVADTSNKEVLSLGGGRQEVFSPSAAPRTPQIKREVFSVRRKEQVCCNKVKRLSWRGSMSHSWSQEGREGRGREGGVGGRRERGRWGGGDGRRRGGGGRRVGGGRRRGGGREVWGGEEWRRAGGGVFA